MSDILSMMSINSMHFLMHMNTDYHQELSLFHVMFYKHQFGVRLTTTTNSGNRPKQPTFLPVREASPTEEIQMTFRSERKFLKSWSQCYVHVRNSSAVYSLKENTNTLHTIIFSQPTVRCHISFIHLFIRHIQSSYDSH